VTSLCEGACREREAISVIRNRRQMSSRPPFSAAPPAEQSRLLQQVGYITIGWFVYFCDV
jgi:hypothetical protein